MVNIFSSRDLTSNSNKLAFLRSMKIRITPLRDLRCLGGCSINIRIDMMLEERGEGDKEKGAATTV